VQKEYSTTAGREFVAPTSRKEYRPTVSVPRYGMVTQDTLTEAAYSYGEGAPPLLKFDATTTSIARAPTAAEEVRFPTTSTAREAAATAMAFSERAAAAASRDGKALLHSVMAPAAGGPGSLRVDRGKRSLGITGEVLRIGQDPKTSTDAQRAWIQRRDPGIHAFRHVRFNAGDGSCRYFTLVGTHTRGKIITHNNHTLPTTTAQPPEPVGETPYMSLPLGGAGASTVKLAEGPVAHGRFAAFAAAPRVVTSVTATAKDIARRPGGGVFSDA